MSPPRPRRLDVPRRRGYKPGVIGRLRVPFAAPLVALAAALLAAFLVADGSRPVAPGPAPGLFHVPVPVPEPVPDASPGPGPDTSIVVSRVAPTDPPATPAATTSSTSSAPSVPEPAPITSHVLVVVRDRKGEPVQGAWVAVVAERDAADGEIGDLGQRPTWKAGQHPATDASGRAVVPLPGPDAHFAVYACFGANEGRSEPFAADRWVVEVVVGPPDPPPPGLGALLLRFTAGGARHGLAPVEVALTRRPILLEGTYGDGDVARGAVRGTTDADGVLAIGRLPTGAYALVVSSPGWADARASVVVEAAATTLDVDLPNPGYDVTGPLVPPAGVGAASVHVRVMTTLGDYPATVEPVKDAPPGLPPLRWRALRLPPGKHLVVGEIAGHAARCEEMTVVGATTLASGPTLSWAWSGSLRGRVVDGERKPTANRGVRLGRDEEPPAVLRPRTPFVNRIIPDGRPRATAEARAARDAFSVDLGLDAETDAEGRFVLRGLAPDTYTLAIGTWSQALAISGDLDLGDLVVVVDPSLHDPVTLTLVGRVVAPGALARARVEVLAGQRLVKAVDVDASGAFSVEVTVERGTALALQASGVDPDGHHLFTGRPLELEAQASPRVVDVPLLAAARLRGRLLLPPALAGRRSAVGVAISDESRVDAPVSADGSWDAGELPAGRPLLVLVPGITVQAVTLEAGEVRVVELDLRDRTIVLAVELRGAPDRAAHAVARVTDEEHQTIQAPLHGDRGVVPGLRAGRAQLVVEVEEPDTGTFWRVHRELDLQPRMAPVVVELPATRGRVRGSLGPAPWPNLVQATFVAGLDRDHVDAAEVGVDARGEFELDLPIGRWAIAAGDRRVEVEVPARATVQVRLDR